MKAACIQMDINICEKEGNIRKALKMTTDAIRGGAEIVVLPEVFSTGFCYDHIKELAEDAPYPGLGPFIELSRKKGCIIIGSIIEANDIDNQYANLGFCIVSGKLTGKYRKTHLFKKENAYFSKGGEIYPFVIPGKNLIIGLEICYELRFPEIARKLAMQGSDILITIAQFPDPRCDQWKTLVRARSIENQLPHIACNRTGSDPDTNYFGHSMIIDASGNIVAEARRKERIVYGDLNLDISEEVRTFIPVFADRREELY
jgi:predicted amidohydrolase